MYGFLICSCVYVSALVFLSMTGTGSVSSWYKLMVAVCMAGGILEIEWSNSFSCLCQKLLISYYSTNVIFLWLCCSLGLF